jgi:uncharacterized protein (DUF169 family)
MAAHDYAAICETLRERLRLRADPLGIKLFETVEAMEAVPGVRRPQKGMRFTMCQAVGQARWLGWTLGVAHENVAADSNCGGVMGLNAPAAKYLDGSMFHNVWFATVEAAQAHQAQMPRVPSGKYAAAVIAPLAKGRLDPPDTVLIYSTPGQMILIVNALQHRNYARCDFTVTGETACADSWGRGLATRQPSISIPCFAERRFGGVQDDELAIALPMDQLEEVARGLGWLAERGIRYPIPPYGVQNDPAAAFQVNYAGKM